MESLKELYRIGRGPSSSHTMGPDRAAKLFKAAFPHADSFKARLYGSLAKTGKGHFTDRALTEAFLPLECSVVYDEHTSDLPHPNTLDLIAFKDSRPIGNWRVLSVGGGKIEILGKKETVAENIYSFTDFDSIKKHCSEKDIRIYEYAEECEGPELWDFLAEVWEQMRSTIRTGLKAEGELEGGLHVERKAKLLFKQHHMDESAETRENRIVCSYAFACGEENAGGGTVVTAPTCGACGVLPSVLLYSQEKRGFSDKEVLRALATAGVVGNIIKTNASISGAECGCQAEIGSACSMAAAGLAELLGMDLDQIEYAAEVAMEHHLGLTCDPIRGLVQIPCIERNAVAAMRAINAISLANFLTHTRRISFDLVVDTMYKTGKDLFSKYRETGEGGLAEAYDLNLRRDLSFESKD